MTDDAEARCGVSIGDTGRDTFRPVSVDDRFTKRVRDDHTANQVLHDVLHAAAEDDDRIHSVNLMGSHAPGNRHKGEPRYNVRVDVRNDGMGHPVLGATVVGRMVDRGNVRIEDVVECSDDHLVVAIRPIETRVEPIDVPVSDIPDDVRGVSEATVAAVLGDIEVRLNEELRSVSPLRIVRDVVDDWGDVLPDPDWDGADDRLQDLDVRLEDFPDGWRDDKIGPVDASAPPNTFLERVEEMAEDDDSALEYSDVLTVVSNNRSREWINNVITDGEDEGDVDPSYNVTTVDGEDWSHDPIEGQDHAARIAMRILEAHAEPPTPNARLTPDGWEWVAPDDERTRGLSAPLTFDTPAFEHGVIDPDAFDEPVTTDEIESFRADFDAEYEARELPEATVFEDFVPYSRRREGKPTVHVAVQDKDDGSLVAQVDGKAEEWQEVDTGRGIWNIRVDVGAKKPAAKPVTAYVCHGCERKTLPDDFDVPSCSCDPDAGDACDECGGHAGPRCPRCGTPVDWDTTHADHVGAEE